MSGKKRNGKTLPKQQNVLVLGSTIFKFTIVFQVSPSFPILLWSWIEKHFDNSKDIIGIDWNSEYAISVWLMLLSRLKVYFFFKQTPGSSSISVYSIVDCYWSSLSGLLLVLYSDFCIQPSPTKWDKIIKKV